MDSRELKIDVGETGTIHIVQGDITEMNTDAIVNAANEYLILGAGVAGAIREKGGALIQQECDKIGRIAVGSAAITTAGNLPAKFVIHAVGPRMGEGHEDEKLSKAVAASLKLAEENRLKSIALPAISTGIFGFPLPRCAEIMFAEISDFLWDSRYLKDIFLVLWDEQAFSIFKNQMHKLKKDPKKK
jgi:O-acetyl-ADP-ribose deacetylase (regulator of RNase III)